MSKIYLAKNRFLRFDWSPNGKAGNVEIQLTNYVKIPEWMPANESKTHNQEYENALSHSSLSPHFIFFSREQNL